MPVFQYEGKHYDLPEGTTNEQAIAKIESHLGKAPVEAAPAPSTMSQMFGAGSPIARFAKGAVVDPALAVNQMLANTGLFGPSVKQGANQTVQQYEQATQEARKAMGSEGFDPYQLAGNILSPVNKVAGAVRAPTAAATGLLSKAGSAAATGAVLAGAQPVVSGSTGFGEKKLEQMATGAVLGPLVEAGVASLGKVASLVKGFTKEGRTQALKTHLDSLAGSDRDKVIWALQDAKEIVKGSRPTAAEALSDVPTAAELIAAQQKLSKTPGLVGGFAERTTENQAARLRALQGISGTAEERLAADALRKSTTGPMREGALDVNEIAQQSLGAIDKQALTTAGNLIKQVKDNLSPLEQTSPAFKLTSEGLTNLSKETAKSLKQAQVDSLKQNGVFPLLTGDIIKKLDTAIQGSDSDMSKAVLQAVKDKLIAKTDSNGLIGSRDLYENVRKMSNAEVAKLLGLGEQYASGGVPTQAAAVLTNVKKYVDSALNKSSGGLWTKYLETYAEHSNKINRMEVGDYLAKKLQTSLGKEQAGIFAGAVEDAASTIKQATGIPRYSELGQVLSKNEVTAVNNVVADLKRVSKAKELGSMAGMTPEGLPDVVKKIPALLSSTLTLGKASLEYLQRGNKKEFDNTMAELLKNPADLAKFMTTAVQQNKTKELVSAMMKNMSPPTQAAFIQAFTVPAVAQEIGK